MNALKALPWFSKVVRDIRAFRVEQWSDFTAFMKASWPCRVAFICTELVSYARSVRAFVCSGILFLTLATSAAGQTPPCPAAQRVATEAKATQSELLKVEIDTFGNNKLPEAAEKIQHLKDLLVQVADAVVGCESQRVPAGSATQVEQVLAQMLNANQPEAPDGPAPDPIPDTRTGVYGSDIKISVEQPAKWPRLLLLQLRFGIGCGFDTVLLVYQKDGDTWRHAVLWQSGRYDREDKAFGDFFTYAVLSDSVGKSRWRIVVAHGHPWCTSRWSAFHIDLIRPADRDVAQKVLWHLDRGYVRFEIEPRLAEMPDGFELRLQIGSIETLNQTRMGVFRYKVLGDHVEREQPVAMNGRDFVDAWLQMDWDDAKRWTMPQKRAELKALHDAYGRRYRNSTKITDYEYGPVLACSDRQLFQVEIDTYPPGVTRNSSGTPTFYRIRQEQNGFTMLSASRKADTRCGGQDLMAEQ